MNGLEDLKKGEKAVCITRHPFGGTFIGGAVVVDHLTATLVVGAKGDKYDGTRIRLDTAKRVGADRYSGSEWYHQDHPRVTAVRQAQADAKKAAEIKNKLDEALKNAFDTATVIAAIKKALAEAGPTPAAKPVANELLDLLDELRGSDRIIFNEAEDEGALFDHLMEQARQ